MKNTKREPRIRYHISKEIAAELEILRRERHFKSWDEFFRAVLILIRSESNTKLPIPDPTPMKTVLTKLISMEKVITHALAKISINIETQQGINQTLQTTLEETHEATNGVRTLLEFALQSENTEPPPSEINDKTSKAIHYLQNRF